MDFVASAMKQENRAAVLCLWRDGVFQAQLSIRSPIRSSITSQQTMLATMKTKMMVVAVVVVAEEEEASV